MASNSSKWLTGCGIGCGVIILICILIGVVGYFAIRGTVEEFKEAEASQEYLEERFGKVEDFAPDPSGEIALLVDATAPETEKQTATKASKY